MGFDDIVFLAKGGRLVYMGPVERAVPYFRSIGYHVPEHANPPDFFIDAISGIVRPQAAQAAAQGVEGAGAGAGAGEGGGALPPVDLVKAWSAARSSFDENTGKKAAGDEGKSGEIGEGASSRSPTLSFGDAIPADGVGGAKGAGQGEGAGATSGSVLRERQRRKTAGFFAQTNLCVRRALVQQRRHYTVLLSDAALVLFAGFFVGMLFRNVPIQKTPQVAFLVSLCTGCLAIQQSVRMFGPERVVFWRESAAGLNRYAYFVGRNVASIPSMLLMPLVFLSCFYTLSQVRGEGGEEKRSEWK